MTETSATPSQNTTTAKIVYILYLVSLLVGFTGLIGLIMAYIYKSEASDSDASHYQFQIRTFWIGFLYFFISAILSVILIGWIGIIFTYIWTIVRCIKGMKAFDAGKAIESPKRWGF